MSSVRHANLNKAIVLVILMITMTQVGYLENINPWTNGEETLDDAEPVVAHSPSTSVMYGIHTSSGLGVQNLTASAEGAELLVGQAMTNITFQYNASAASGSGSGSGGSSGSGSNSGTYNGNGTAWLFKDIYSGTDNTYPRELTVIGNTLYFAANDGPHGNELWKSDGTSSGTVMVKDIVSGSSSSTPISLTAVGNTLYFVAYEGTHGSELWKSDGTSSGTVMVKDIRSGSSASNPSFLTAVGNTLYFAANDGTNGIELWKSDGTASGTVMVKDIGNANTAMGGDPQYLTAVGNTLYFAAIDGTNGVELWKSDGTASGTVMVKNIRSGSTSSSPYEFTAIGNTLYFAANDGINGIELWKSDGTASGTVMVKDIYPGGIGNSGLGSSGNPIAAVGNTLYFRGQDGTHGYELWKSDGTSSGTVMVKDIRSGSSSSPTRLTAAGNTLYFAANDGTNGEELWKSDGTSSGTVMVKDIRSGSTGGDLLTTGWTSIGNTLFFVADDGTHGEELWKSDGTSSGTVMVQNIRSGSGSSSPEHLTGFGNTLFFRADDGTNGIELWALDPANITGLGGGGGSGGGSSSSSSFAYANDKVAAGNEHTCAILENGDLKCWGYDYYGQLGDGGSPTNTNAPSSTAIDLGTGRTAVAVSAGVLHTCVILDNGDLKCWGRDNYGQLGDGGSNTNTDAPSSTAIDLGTGRTAVAVSAGLSHTCAILDNGDLKCWGQDYYGQLGDGGSSTNTNAPSSTAIDLGTGRTAVAVSAGTHHTCAILDNGDLKCWGYDQYGQLGDGGTNTDTNAPSSTAIDLGTGRTAVAVSAGYYHTCVILDNGDLKCWGYDYYGQLGDGGQLWTSSNPTDTNTPSSTAIDLGTGRTAVAVSANHHTCAILDNGDLKCWGYNQYGQLGDGGSNTNTNAPSSTAIDLGTGRTAVAVSVGSGHTCAILDNGDSKCMGWDYAGQLGDGGTTPGTDQASPVAVSGSNTWDSSTGLSSGSGSATQSNFTASIEGADLIIDEPMTNITFQYNASAASGSGSGSNSGTYNGNGTAWMVENIANAATSSFPDRLTAVGNTLFFKATNGQNGFELWKSNGTSSGTVMVKDINSGSLGQATSNPNHLTEMGGTLYFSAMDTSNNGHQLWKSDGTASGTVMVTAINSGGTANPGIHTDGFVVMNNNLYFSADDGPNGVELWKSDGTASGTVMVKDITSGSAGSFSYTPAVKPVVMNNELYFNANDGINGYELWKSDGTASGTVMVKDINIGGSDSFPQHLTVVGNTLYFDANDGTNGNELWKSDGTASGTVMVKDIAPIGTSASSPQYLTGIGNTLYFQATDGTNGIELWKSDGTASGTVMVQDINSGGSGSSPKYLTVVDNTLYFQATDGTNGNELWKSDGTASGTVMVQDIHSSAASSSYPQHLTAFGNTSISKPMTGTEPNCGRAMGLPQAR